MTSCSLAVDNLCRTEELLGQVVMWRIVIFIGETRELFETKGRGVLSSPEGWIGSGLINRLRFIAGVAFLLALRDVEHLAPI